MGRSVFCCRQINVGLGDPCARHVSRPRSPVLLAARSVDLEISGATATGQIVNEYTQLKLGELLELTSDNEQHIAANGIGHMIVGHTAKVANIGTLRLGYVQIGGAIAEGCVRVPRLLAIKVTRTHPLDMLLGQWLTLHTAREHGILAGIHNDVLRHRLDGGAIYI